MFGRRKKQQEKDEAAAFTWSPTDLSVSAAWETWLRDEDRAEYRGIKLWPEGDGDRTIDISFAYAPDWYVEISAPKGSIDPARVDVRPDGKAAEVSKKRDCVMEFLDDQPLVDVVRWSVGVVAASSTDALPTVWKGIFWDSGLDDSLDHMAYLQMLRTDN